MAETVNLSLVSLPPEEKKKEQRKEWRARSGDWFGVMLYPNEDDRHKRFISYIESHSILFPSFVYIDHYKDIYTELDVIKWRKKYGDDVPPDFELGDLKKRHYHFIFKRAKKCPASTVKNFFGAWVSHVELIEDYVFYINYMLHDDPDSIFYGKPPYSPDELKGDPSVISEAIIQNANSALFDEIFHRILEFTDESSLLYLYQVLEKEKPYTFSLYKRVIQDNSYIFKQFCFDMDKRLERERWDKLKSPLRDSLTGEILTPIYWNGNRYR